MRMDAIAARKLAIESLRSTVIQPFLDEIHNKIQEAVKAGKFEIMNLYSSNSNRYPSTTEQEAICSELSKLGYKVTNHPDPDPGDPRSRPYTTVSW